MFHRIRRLEGRQPADRSCPACGHDGTYRVEYRTGQSPPPRDRCAVCGDRSLIIVEFVEAPLPACRESTEPARGDADSWPRQLRQETR
ncbi:MAG: hypothetical protein AB7O77_17300 [Phycisphaerales bacterium]